MKKHVLFLVFLAGCLSAYPQYDKAKHYQWRSMEDGPWEFYPKAYYYTWVEEGWLYDVFGIKAPGFGAHDNGPFGIGTGDHYVDRYGPTGPHRAAVAGSAFLEKGYYEEENENINSWNKRETLYNLDRAVDLAYAGFRAQFADLKDRFLKNMEEYTALCDGKEDLAYGNRLLDEYNRILDNKAIISGAWMENAKRQESYSEMTGQLKDLNSSVVALVKIAYSKKKNIHFLKK